MLDDLLGEQGLEFVGMCKTTPPGCRLGCRLGGSVFWDLKLDFQI
jgi:hypothetical protein